MDLSFLWKVWAHSSKCYKLQAAKRANKPKVPMPQAQDLMMLIGELVKALNLYSNPGVGNHSHVNKNFNARGVSKKFWMQKLNLIESF